MNYPLFVNVISRLTNYYLKLCDRDKDSLVAIAVDIHKSTKDSWFQFFEYIVQILGFKLSNNFVNVHSICNKLRILSNEIFIGKLHEYSSFKLYAEIKTHVYKENYLTNVHNELYRKFLSCLRLSCHNLPIVIGRYNNLNVNDRLCTKCKITVGNEYHCLMECFDQQVTNIRNKFFTTIFDINPSLKYLDRLVLFKYIMLFADKNILHPSSKFIFEIFSLYKISNCNYSNR